MKPDPKFGYHGIWLAPLAIILIGINRLSTSVEKFCYRRKIARIYRENPDIKHMTDLAGINKDKK